MIKLNDNTMFVLLCIFSLGFACVVFAFGFNSILAFGYPLVGMAAANRWIAN